MVLFLILEGFQKEFDRVFNMGSNPNWMDKCKFTMF